MRISEVARQFNLNTQTIYFYERIGLIPEPMRTQAGYRVFDEADIERLSLIERAKGLGLTLDEIKQILELKAGKELTCAEVHRRLHSKLQDIENKIKQLQALREELMPLVKRCEETLSQTENLTDCGVFQVDSL